MTIKKRYFPTQGANEKIFLLIRRHWFVFAVLAFFIFIMILPLMALGVYWLMSPEVFSSSLGNFIIIFASIYTLVVIALSLYGFVNYYLDVYIITNERLVDIKQNGFFHREIAELHLRQVQDVEARVEGIWKTLLHFGDVYIQTAGERENFIFEDVPRPYSVAKKIAELHQQQVHPARRPEKDMTSKKSEDIILKSDQHQDEEYSPYVDERFNGSSKKEEVEDIANKNEGYGDHNDKISSVEQSPDRRKDEEEKFGIYDKPKEEIIFNIDNQNDNKEKDINKGLNELSEGEEVKLDEHN